MGTRRFVAIAALLAAFVTAGCANGAGGVAEPGGSVPPSQPDSSQGGSLPPTFRATPPPPGKSLAAGEQVLTGQVEAGVEAGCMIMRMGQVTYLLVDGDRAVIQPGARVTVRGKAMPDMMTTCQQGLPFRVTEAHPA